ncbi:bcl-2-binding component 3, isoforms 3/4-like [Cavia porcellus]|uniref:bcl-2-binding component 3, isoforms 3/4-like n=1 Tax=Cavia porcellus TaxID=10141 RepID=UPI002FE0472E
MATHAATPAIGRRAPGPRPLRPGNARDGQARLPPAFRRAPRLRPPRPLPRPPPPARRPLPLRGAGGIRNCSRRILNNWLFPAPPPRPPRRPRRSHWRAGAGAPQSAAWTTAGAGAERSERGPDFGAPAGRVRGGTQATSLLGGLQLSGSRDGRPPVPVSPLSPRLPAPGCPLAVSRELGGHLAGDTRLLEAERRCDRGRTAPPAPVPGEHPASASVGGRVTGSRPMAVPPDPFAPAGLER